MRPIVRLRAELCPLTVPRARLAMQVICSDVSLEQAIDKGGLPQPSHPEAPVIDCSSIETTQKADAQIDYAVVNARA
jgi:hypothetical protein